MLFPGYSLLGRRSLLGPSSSLYLFLHSRRNTNATLSIAVANGLATRNNGQPSHLLPSLFFKDKLIICVNGWPVLYREGHHRVYK